MSAVDRVVDWAVSTLGDALLGGYLHGSAVIGGLRPESDLDVLLVVSRSLAPVERGRLVDLLMRISGRRATEGPGRPLEVTVVVQGDVVPWRYPPTCDLLYGEWLRDLAAAGELAGRHTSPDLAVVLTQARDRSEVLVGSELTRLTEPVPPADLRRALLDCLPALLSDLEGDERNVLLTLARMVTTLETGRIVSKDVAAGQVEGSLAAGQRRTLRLASDAYLGAAVDDWAGRGAEVAELAATLARRVRTAGRRVVVLVEGESDAVVVRILLRRRGIADVDVVSMGGVTNVRTHLRALAADGDEPLVLGLVDAPEERFALRALRSRGREVRTRGDLAREGFFVCDVDLEDELLRAVGPAGVERALDALGDLPRFRTFQKQPEWRDRSRHDQLHRFAGSGSGRKVRLAERLADSLTPETTPPVLRRLVDRAGGKWALD